MQRQAQTCCFTGHRDIADGDYARIQSRLSDVLTQLIDQGVRYFGAGGALGFDTMAALTVLQLRALHSHIRMILVLPYREQARSWSFSDQKIYNQIRQYADKVVYTSEDYYDGCLYRRNRHLVDNSGVCVCYLTHPTGGTVYTVDYARQMGLRIINLAMPQYPPP